MRKHIIAVLAVAALASPIAIQNALADAAHEAAAPSLAQIQQLEQRPRPTRSPSGRHEGRPQAH